MRYEYIGVKSLLFLDMHILARLIFWGYFLLSRHPPIHGNFGAKKPRDVTL